MLALRARQAANYQCDESFTYYVDPVAGLDGNTGSKALPYQTLGHALSVATAGQSIGIKAGSEIREGAQRNIPADSIRLGKYGSGALPIVSGGTVVTGWASTATSTPTSNILTNGDLETWVSGSPSSWTVLPTVTQSTAQHESGTSSAQVRAGTTNGKIHQTISSGLTSSAPYAVTFWHLEDTLSIQVSTQITCVANGVTNYLTAGGTWTTTNTVIQINTVTSWTQFSIGFMTLPLTTQLTVFGQSFSGGSYNAYVDNFVMGPSAAGNTYSATLASTPTMVVAGTTPLTQGSSSTTLTTNQWFYTGGTLFVNLGGTNPSGVTVETNAVIPLFVNTHNYPVFRNRDIRFGLSQALKTSTCMGGIVDRCNFQWTADVSSSGNVLLAEGSAVGAAPWRITRSTFQQLLNDGIWVHNTQNVQIDHNTMSQIGFLAGDIQSDGIQIEDTFITGGLVANPTSAGAWIHHNSIDMTGSFSPKGCVLHNDYYNTTAGALVEHNTLKGGNYGVAVSASGMIVRYNTISGQISNFGGNIHVDTVNTATINVQLSFNLMTGSSRSGLIIQATSNPRYGWTINKNTIANAAWSGLDIQAPFGGTIEDDIIWCPGATAPVLRVTSIEAGQTLNLDYCIIGPESTGFISWLGTSYNTLAAWQTATGLGAHCSSSDPKFTNSSGGDFTLQAGSPAIGAASDGGNIGAL